MKRNIPAMSVPTSTARKVIELWMAVQPCPSSKMIGTEEKRR